jgi:hypothetical protein
MQRKGMRTPNRSQRTGAQREAEDKIADEQVKKGTPGKVARRNARTAVGRVSGGTQKGKKTGTVGARVAREGGKKTAQRKATRQAASRSAAQRRKAKGGSRVSHRSGADA